MKRIRTARSRARAGFSMYEMVIAVGLMLILSTALIESLGNLRNLSTFSESRVGIQQMADETLLEMIGELRQSGAITVGVDYPYVFDGGDANPDFDNHDHPAADGDAQPGDADFGPDREVVFLLPADADNDSRPDINGNGDLVWGASEISYTVTTRADGVNYLERRVDAGAPRIVGHHVERLVVDTAESSGFEIPLGSIRVRLFFRDTDSNGNLIRYSTEAVVALKNS